MMIRPIVLYYSNRDNGNSAAVIANIQKYNISSLLSVCVDNENCVMENNKRYAILNRDTKVCVPNAIQHTPALYVTSENKILFGSQILSYLSNMIDMMKNAATNNNGEPEAFFDGFSNFNNNFSDNYAMISQQGEHIVESNDSGKFVDCCHNNAMTVNSTSIEAQSVSNNKMSNSEIDMRTKELSKPINVENKSMSVDQFKEYNNNLTNQTAMPQYNQIMQKINQTGQSYKPMPVARGAMCLEDYNNYNKMNSSNYAQNYINNRQLSSNYNANEFQVSQSNKYDQQYRPSQQVNQQMQYSPMMQQHQQQWSSQMTPQYQQYKQQRESQMPVQRQSPMMQQQGNQYVGHRGKEYNNNVEHYQQRMNQYQSQYGIR
jgi:hypothetical protein